MSGGGGGGDPFSRAAGMLRAGPSLPRPKRARARALRARFEPPVVEHEPGHILLPQRAGWRRRRSEARARASRARTCPVPRARARAPAARRLPAAAAAAAPRRRGSAARAAAPCRAGRPRGSRGPGARTRRATGHGRWLAGQMHWARWKFGLSAWRDGGWIVEGMVLHQTRSTERNVILSFAIAYGDNPS